MTALAIGAFLIGAPVQAGAEEYTLRFIPTQNLPGEQFPNAQGVMTMRVLNGQTVVRVQVRGAWPNTLYTIWTVFNVLTGPDGPSFDSTRDQMIAYYATRTGHSVPSSGASERPGFPVEGNGVSPTAPLGAGFTSGMGPDPGATFATNENGDGQIEVKLDFDLLNDAPVSNKDIIGQCTPVPGTTIVEKSPGKFATVCIDSSSKLLRVTTTWLRTYIGQIPVAERAASCANYDARFDPSSGVYDDRIANGSNALQWQCVDPNTGLPRVPRFAFDHFRLANHPDDLTHGFIGGNGIDHWIDMVGRRADLVQGNESLSSTAKSKSSSRSSNSRSRGGDPK